MKVIGLLSCNLLDLYLGLFYLSLRECCAALSVGEYQSEVQGDTPQVMALECAI